MAARRSTTDPPIDRDALAERVQDYLGEACVSIAREAMSLPASERPAFTRWAKRLMESYARTLGGAANILERRAKVVPISIGTTKRAKDGA